MAVTCGDNGGHKTNGDPCNRPPMVGMTRCALHGGKNPVARIKAEQMLALARLPACEALYTILEDWNRTECPLCHYPSGDVATVRTIIRACEVILDRSGVGPRSTIELTKQADGDLNLDLLTPEERTQLVEHIEAIKAIKAAVRVRQEGDAAARARLPPRP